ncbi:uncharacterized protein EI90DRAFT_3231753 [Cantharellus anzutake]|uniref:uncharacterized protein n=1 Tax=Cantharellus anzutake TaxID=1750568 RepID=UPI001908CF64|nr:uncharacterized protein EI90DRAFT_3231753 [Cantharellus anzutake]KAF8326114.1 hypothetical protein EI90DRAFT_3231753 [Cantharellus anzutake]
MLTNFQLEKMPTHRVGSQPATEEDANSEYSEQFKPIRITVALLVPKKGKDGKDKKPNTIQKQFQLDVLGSNREIEPSIFWGAALGALGPGYSTVYVLGNGTGKWPIFKWHKEGAAASKRLLIETNVEFSSMIQAIRSQMLLTITIKVNLDDFQAMLQPTPSTTNAHWHASYEPPGYGNVGKAPSITNLTPLEAERAAKVVQLQEQWACIDPHHTNGQYCFICKAGDLCIPLSPHALKHWASSWIEGTASLNSPPNSHYFDLTTHHHSKSQSHTPGNPPANNQLETLMTLALVAMVSTLNPKASALLVPPTHADKVPSPKKQITTVQPLGSCKGWTGMG